jgi:hypothetical protein
LQANLQKSALFTAGINRSAALFTSLAFTTFRRYEITQSWFAGAAAYNYPVIGLLTTLLVRQRSQIEESSAVRPVSLILHCLPCAMAGVLLAGMLSAAKAAEKIEIVPQTGHYGGVFSIAFLPDGKHIVSGGGDETLTAAQFKY